MGHPLDGESKSPRLARAARPFESAQGRLWGSPGQALKRGKFAGRMTRRLKRRSSTLLPESCGGAVEEPGDFGIP
jgi:hypothetical protein